MCFTALIRRRSVTGTVKASSTTSVRLSRFRWMATKVAICMFEGLEFRLTLLSMFGYGLAAPLRVIGLSQRVKPADLFLGLDV